MSAVSGARAWQALAVLAGAGAAIAVLYYLISALYARDALPAAAQRNIVLHKVQGQGQHGTKLGWTFDADWTELSIDGATTTYHQVRGGTYYRDDRPIYKMTADEVTLDNRTLAYAAKNVHIWSVGSAQLSDLQTSAAVWNNGPQVLLCPQTVHLVYKGATMTTSTLSANFSTGATALGKTQIDFR